MTTCTCTDSKRTEYKYMLNFVSHILCYYKVLALCIVAIRGESDISLHVQGAPTSVWNVNIQDQTTFISCFVAAILNF